ncbi:MAG TPA: tRNA preQ1(34) S-adenosylmethionine ribosyltransferase-isomerase QueA [Candidatus Methylomirabilis sp.]
MRVADLAYDLPEGLIAQAPAAERDGSRLLVLTRAAGVVGHHVFRELPALLRPGDLLVLNDTKVIPARLAGRWESGGGVELLLVREVEPGAWEALVKPAAKARPGRLIALGDGGRARVAAYAGPGRRLLRFDPGGDVRALLERHGLMPLPPYIHRPVSRIPHGTFGDSAIRNPQSATDRERYQTVYALEEGAIAAPTAGLHFTEALLDAVAGAGIEVRRITLHVGPGTFQPIRAARIRDHRMEPERYAIPEATAQAVKAAKAEGRRVIAVGTTAVRTLEHSAMRGGEVQAGPAEAELFIIPGHRFRVVDGMLTNFHLPGSTPLALVAALAGLERIKAAYAEAVARGYRFYSYGDAMLIL